MDERKIKWGIIGLGNIAIEFADAIKETGTLVAVASRTISKRVYFNEHYKIDYIYDNYDDLVNNPEVDAVYVATVNSQHFDNIKSSLDAGKHVLCEKAIWGKSQELKELKNLADSNNLILAEAMTIYHMPLLKEVKKLINNGKIGRVKTVKADLGSLKEASNTNRFFSKELGGGAMLDIGTYTLSFIRYFVPGKFIERTHVCQKYETGVDEMWSIAIKSDEGAVGSTNLSFRSKLPKRAIIAGELGYFEIDNYVRPEIAKLVYPDGSIEWIEAGKTENALMYEIVDFEKTICGNEDAVFIQETMEVVSIMDQLLNVEKIY